MTDAVLSDLRKACDDRARPAHDVDSIGGVPARYEASPASTEEASAVLRTAAQHDLRVVARGMGTKRDWGAPPESVDLILDTTLIDGVVEHAAGDLVVVVRAGTLLEDLQATLAEAGQQLALDAPLRGATVGGTIAMNTSGPRRLLYGTLRDLLIGVTFVRADGVVAKSGGKVVKNVAGYDFGKLLIGSYGTLGIVTEAAFRLHPLPPASRFLSVEVPTADEAGRLVAAVLDSQLVPSAVEVEQPAEGSTTVTVLLEGTEDGVAGRARTAGDLLGGAREADEPPSWFAAFPFGSSDVGLRMTTELSGLPRLLGAVREASDKHSVPVHARGSAVGTLYAGVPASVSPQDAGAVLDDLRSAAASCGGSVVVLTAPPAVGAAVDRWGPVPGLDLMRRVKEQLDPDRRLSPGRFAGGI